MSYAPRPSPPSRSKEMEPNDDSYAPPHPPLHPGMFTSAQRGQVPGSVIRTMTRRRRTCRCRGRSRWTCTYTYHVGKETANSRRTRVGRGRHETNGVGEGPSDWATRGNTSHEAKPSNEGKKKRTRKNAHSTRTKRVESRAHRAHTRESLPEYARGEPSPIVTRPLHRYACVYTSSREHHCLCASHSLCVSVFL